MNLPVKKIELVLPKEGLEKTIDALQVGGFLEIIPEKDNRSEEPLSQNEDLKLYSSEAEFALSFLKKFEEKENFAVNLILSFAPTKEGVTREDIQEVVSSSKIREVVKSCAEIEEKINLLNSKKDELLGEKKVLERFKNTTIIAGVELKKTIYFAGEIGIKEKELFLNDLGRKNCYIESGEETASSFNFVLYYEKKSKDLILKVLQKYGAKEEIVFWKETPRIALEKVEKKIKDIELESDIQFKEAQKLLFYVPKLKAFSDWLTWEMEKDDFLKKSGRTQRFVVLRAWTPEKAIKEIKDTLKRESSFFLLKEIPLQEGDNPPVVLLNRGTMGSFGIVTGVYGLPKKHEIDPTPYLAPFFIFYFALALSDSGYGLLLAALAFLGKKFLKKANADKFFNLFIFCGILTAIIGLFIGTFFGGSIAKSLMIADPMSDPISALIFVLALGFFQIFVGLVINLVWLIKNGQTDEALAGSGASIIFFIGIVLYLVTGNSSFVIAGVIMMASFAFIFSQAEGIFQRMGRSFGSVYALTGYFGDILSYSRILALGLATGIIAAVINMIAMIFKEMIPVPGLDLLVAGVILVVGHIGNLLINALGAFIHSARLQFVEFFSKFMEGGGRHFKPLSKKGRYVEIIN